MLKKILFYGCLLYSIAAHAQQKLAKKTDRPKLETLTLMETDTGFHSLELLENEPKVHDKSILSEESPKEDQRNHQKKNGLVQHWNKCQCFRAV